MIKGYFRGLFCLILWFLLGGHERKRATLTWGADTILNGTRVPKHSFHFQSPWPQSVKCTVVLYNIRALAFCFMGIAAPCVLVWLLLY